MMKILHTLIFSFTWILGIATAYAQTQIDIQGVTAPVTVQAGETVQLNLTGDVTVNTNTPFTVMEGGELRIVNATSGPVTITNTYENSNGRDGMFLVYSTGRLIMTGGSGKEIILDGGSALIGSPGSYTPGNANRHFNSSLIRTTGTLQLDYVTIRNFYSEINDSGTIGVVAPSIYDYGADKTCGTTTLRNCLIERCRARMGTFMFIGNGGSYLSSSMEAEDCRIDITDCTIQDCESYCDENGWGGAIRCRGGSINNLYLTNTTFTRNYSRGDGPTLWWNAGGRADSKCVIDGCSFTYNEAERDAGGLRLEGTFQFSGNKTIVSNNRCNGVNKFAALNRVLGNGGGIQIYGYAGTADAVGGTLTYRLPECLEVTDNIANGYGGGIAFEFNTDKLTNGTNIYADFDGTLIERNYAGISGGGVYMTDDTPEEKNYSFFVNLNSGTIQNNTAPDGGGMYISKLDVSSDAGGTKSLYIRNNTAEDTDGTGDGGGIYLNAGNLTLQRTVISGNNAHNGGGLFVSNGAFTTASGSEISSNSSSEYGGGVYIYNSSETTKETVTLSAGTIRNNTCKYGGGMAAYGNLNVILNNTSLEFNTAENGGGIFVKGLKSGSGTIVDYNSGIIRYNMANSTSQIETAYNKTHTEAGGIGGGIYMGQYTHLRFNSPEEFGIYSNRATNAADDLFNINMNTYLELPDVENLQLSGFNEAKVQKLYWVEDYVINDPMYYEGLKLKGDAWDSDQTNQRYRDVNENKVDGEYYAIEFGGNASIHYSGKYICLAIGWHINEITLVKEGMKDGENAIFKIYKEGEEYMTVMLTDNDKREDGKRYKEIALKSDGEYRIVELDWSWAYDGGSEITRTFDINTSAEDRILTFTNTPKQDVPIHKEAIKTNYIIIPNQ